MAAPLGRQEATVIDLLDMEQDMGQVFLVAPVSLEDLGLERNMLDWELEPDLLVVLTSEQEEHLQ